MVSVCAKDRDNAMRDARVFMDCGVNVGIFQSKVNGEYKVAAMGKYDRSMVYSCVTDKGVEGAKE